MYALRHACRRAAPLGYLPVQSSALSRTHIQSGALHRGPAPRQQHSQPSGAAGGRVSPPVPLLPPLNITRWARENAHLLQPPINNYCVHSSPLTVMIVGGPNARTEFHINSTPEFFYQHRGRMLLKTIDPVSGEGRDVYIGEGDVFLLPGGVPHNPVRFADTVGIVVEQPRPEGEEDRLRWYCAGCGETVHEAGFVATDLGRQIKEAVLEFEKDDEGRECKACGIRCEVRPSEEEMERMRTGPH